MKKLIDYLSNFIELIANVSFSCSVLLVVVSVFLRPLKIASPWADEGACLLFIWTVFLSAAIALRRNVHIRIDVMLVRLHDKIQELVLFILNILCLLFCIGILYGAFQMTQAARTMRSPALELSMFFFYLPLFLGFLMMVIYLTIFVFDFIVSKKNVSGSG